MTYIEICLILIVMIVAMPVLEELIPLLIEAFKDWWKS